MTRYCLPLLMLLLAGNGLCAQTTIHVRFDSTGQMVKYPTPVVRGRDDIQFSVEVPRALLDSELVAFKALLQADSGYLADPLVNGAYKAFINTDTIDDYTAAVRDLLAHWPSSCASRITSNNLHLPVDAFFQNLYDNQFEILVMDRSRKLDVVQLAADNGHCTDICVRFIGTVHLHRYFCKNCPSMPLDSLRFQLVRFNPLTKTAADWYKVAKNRGFQQLNYDDVINQLLALDGAHPNTIARNLVTSLRGWFMDWFWLSKGQFVLDPFRQISKTKVSDATCRASMLDSTIGMLRERLAFNDSVKRHVPFKEWREDQFKRVQSKGADIQAEIKSDSLERVALLKAVNASDPASLGVGTIINQVDVYLSRGNLVRPQKQFDAASRLSNAWARERRQQRVSEIPQTERLFVVVYNIDSSASVKLTEKPGAFDDQADFTKNGVNALNFSVSGSASQVTGIVNNLQSFRLLGNNIPPGSAPPGGDDMARVVQMLKSLRDDYQAGNITFPLNADLFARQTYTAPLFATFARPMTLLSAPYSDSFSIRQVIKKDTMTTLSFVNVGKLRHFQLAAGLAFLTQPATITTIDTSGGGFKVKTASSTAAAVLGIKFYPIRSFNRDNGIIPRYPLRHLSVFGGFNMLHPLNDFYAGFGYDIVPGLSFILGKNYYVKTAYQVQNNQIINSERVFHTGNSFFAVTVDPVLFFTIVKSFF